MIHIKRQLSLLNEAEETLLDVGRGIIREEGVRSVMEELSYSISNDEIFKQILDRYRLSYIATDVWNHLLTQIL